MNLYSDQNVQFVENIKKLTARGIIFFKLFKIYGFKIMLRILKIRKGKIMYEPYSFDIFWDYFKHIIF